MLAAAGGEDMKAKPYKITWHRCLAVAAVLVFMAACTSARAPTATPSAVGATPALTAVPSAPLETLETGQRALDYVRRLAVELGPRDTPSGGEQRAAGFLVETFQRSGYQVRLQEFTVSHYSTKEPFLSLILPQSEKVESFPLRGSAEGDVRGPVVFARLAKAEDFLSLDVAGKVVLAERGEVPFQAKAENAARAKAKAVVIFNNRTGSFLGAFQDEGEIPAVSISREDGLKLKELLSAGRVEVRVRVTKEELPSQNVIAERVGRQDQVVLLIGHYDSVPDTQGAHDNASGAAILLSLAEVLAGRDFPFTIRLIPMGAEELGLVGSERYVESLTSEERAKIVAVLNFDAVGADTPLAVGGNATIGDQLRKTAERLGFTLTRASGDIPSDHLSFTQKGIPAVIITTPDFSYIHMPEDTFERVPARPLAQAVSLALAFLEDLAKEVAP